MISLIAQIMNFLTRLIALKVTPFIICFHRIVQVICVCVVIPSSYLNTIQICISNRSLFEICLDILNKIGYWYLVVLSLFYCSFRVFIDSMFHVHSLHLCVILCRSLCCLMCVCRILINKDYLLTYLSTPSE